MRRVTDVDIVERRNGPRLATRAVAAATLPVLLAGCSSDYSWGWYVVLPVTAVGRRNIAFLLSGLGCTLDGPASDGPLKEP